MLPPYIFIQESQKNISLQFYICLWLKINLILQTYISYWSDFVSLYWTYVLTGSCNTSISKSLFSTFHILHQFFWFRLWKNIYSVSVFICVFRQENNASVTSISQSRNASFVVSLYPSSTNRKNTSIIFIDHSECFNWIHIV